MIVLGIETSCDETACGIVEIDDNQNTTLLANVVATSMDLHVVYGGVVPEIAARSHIEYIIPVIEKALKQAFESGKLKVESEKLKVPEHSTFDLQPSTVDFWDKIDAIAVTYGAGLSGCLLVGVMTAKTLAITKNKPLYAVNHVEGHVYANLITRTGELKVESEKLKVSTKEPSTLNLQPSTNSWKLGNQTYVLPKRKPEFPMLALIMSGKHTQLVLFRNHFDYTVLGQTRDDAIGEAFDKVAKILGLPYPGGPSVAKAAELGNPHKYSLPKARLDGDTSALKALRLEIEESRLVKLHPKSSILNPQSKNLNYDFSFSGLKTAVLRLAQEQIGEGFTFPSFKIADRLSEAQKADISASFEHTAVETVVDKTVTAIKEFQPKSVVIAGGVAANQELRRQLEAALLKVEGLKLKVGTSQSLILYYTDIKLCTDNGAMIATLGCYKAMLGAEPADPYTLEIQPSLSM